MPKLNGKSPYLSKDQAKSDRANKFIGRGSPASSTNQYRKDWGNLANTGSYESDDVIFISVEGSRRGRLTPDWAELDLAIAAKATFITDDQPNRLRTYNVGEREIACYLRDNGYTDKANNGYWTMIK